MKKVNIVIVEDKVEFSTALKDVLQKSDINCAVHVLNPNRENLPTFEEFNDEILKAIDGWGIVLLDQQLGNWRWTGAHLAPSFINVIGISSEQRQFAKIQFTKKTDIAFHECTKAKTEFVELVKSVAATMFPEDL